MKKIMLSVAFLVISSSMLAMNIAIAPAKSADVAAAKKAGDEKKSNDVTKAKPEDATKKRGLLACLSCDSCKSK